MKPKLIVHGGAWNIPDEQVAAHLNGIEHSITKTFEALEKGLSALDAVELAINHLELDPTYDAGKGAFLNKAGEIELDAIIMDGLSLNFGAVACVQNIFHPVSLARQVMDNTEHAFLAGKGAQQFAIDQGFEILDPKQLLTERELVFFDKIKEDPEFMTHHPFRDSPSDTVGAVAMDINGNLAVATSTGGTPRKLPGRVGDSPIIGAGAYADNSIGAASTTGWGESIMKVLLAKTVCDLFEHNSAGDAARIGIAKLQQKVGGLGGVIGINSNGEYAYAHNTPRMAFAYVTPSGQVVSKIKITP